MAGIKEKLKNFKMPHTYVILITIMALVLVLTHIIPAGQYQRVEDPVSGKNIVVADSFEYVDDVEAPGIFDMFLALEAGYVDAADIMFLIVFAYGFVYILTKNGTMDAALGTLVKKFGNNVQLLIPITMLILGIMASTMGIYEEVYGLFPVFVGIFMALGYDAVVGGAVIFLGVSIGYAAGTTNPYTIAIAQDIAEVPLYSGMGFRWVIFAVTEVIAILYVMAYARKVKKDPKKSVLYGCDLDGIQARSIDELQAAKMSTRQILCLVEFFGVLLFLFYAILNLGWYIDEISAFFFMAMVVAGILRHRDLQDLHRVHQVHGFLHAGGGLHPRHSHPDEAGHDHRHHRARSGGPAERHRHLCGRLRHGHHRKHRQAVHQRFHLCRHHHHAHPGPRGRAGGYEPLHRGSGVSAGTQLCRHLLAHGLRTVLRPHGRAHQQVVQIHYSSVRHSLRNGVRLYHGGRVHRVLILYNLAQIGGGFGLPSICASSQKKERFFYAYQRRTGIGFC